MRNRSTLPLLFFLLAAGLTNFFAQRVWAQTAGASAATSVLTAGQMKVVKELSIPNPEKDTYLKAGGFILDRYEERPAYTFQYSDGVTRKIYLYRVFSADSPQELGLLALYQNGKTGEVKRFVLPGEGAERSAWDAYLDDLKYVGEKEPGLMSALTFALSREFATLLAGPKPADGGTKKKEEFNFCFAPETTTYRANGQPAPLGDIRPGDWLLGYDQTAKRFKSVRVTTVQRHAGTFALSRVALLPADALTAGQRSALPAPVWLEGTANHPVLTTDGPQPLGELRPGATVLRHDDATRPAQMWRVVRVEPGVRTVSDVISLRTTSGAWLADDVVVLDK